MMRPPTNWELASMFAAGFSFATAVVTFLNGARQAREAKGRAAEGPIITKAVIGRLLRWLLSASIGENLIGDIQERYHSRCKRLGEQRAAILRWQEILSSVWSVLLDAPMRQVRGVLARWKQS
jgi:hypothetical protein